MRNVLMSIVLLPSVFLVLQGQPAAYAQRVTLPESPLVEETDSNLPDRRGITARPASSYSSSRPLDFEAALRSLQELRSLPSGFISSEGLRGAEEWGCWVVDQRGRRIDLSALCNQR